MTEKATAVLTAALEKLACLGNGSRVGNSIGNEIAITALRKVFPNEYKDGYMRGVYMGACYCKDDHICTPCAIKREISI